MNLNAVAPIISASLSRLRASFEHDEANTLESIFRTTFDTLAQMQHTVAKVVNANVAQPTWLAPTLLNSWVWFGSASYNPQYSKDEQGNVRLRGMIKNGSAINTVAFTLPAGFRPTQSIRFAVPSNSAFGMVQVDSNGNVTPVIGSTVSVSLDGIEFFAEA